LEVTFVIPAVHRPELKKIALECMNVSATWVAETCRWLLFNKITFIHSNAFVGIFKKIYTSLMQEHGTYKANQFCIFCVRTKFANCPFLCTAAAL
jgi:hypothetical protein